MSAVNSGRRSACLALATAALVFLVAAPMEAVAPAAAIPTVPPPAAPGALSGDPWAADPMAPASATDPTVPASATDPTTAAPTSTGLPDLGAILGDAFAAVGTLGDRLSSGLDSVTLNGTGPCGSSSSLNYGKDGRLTVLLLGTDWRRPSEVHGKYLGERTDVIIVATAKPGHKIAFAAIPRDTVYVPRAASNGGGTWGLNRVNAIYPIYRRHMNAYRVDCRALNKLKADIAATLQTEIDYYVMVRFHTLTALVNKIRGIKVDVPGPIIDSYLKGGLYFPKANDYQLDDFKKHKNCHDYPSKCHSALLYARSRHGSQAGGANSDFTRARRQMDMIMAAGAKVVARGWHNNLSNLAAYIHDAVWSNLPKTYTTALVLYGIANGAKVGYKDSVVFGPRSWATTYPKGTYTFRLRLSRVRSWINEHFGS